MPSAARLLSSGCDVFELLKPAKTAAWLVGPPPLVEDMIELKTRPWRRGTALPDRSLLANGRLSAKDWRAEACNDAHPWLHHELATST